MQLLQVISDFGARNRDEKPGTLRSDTELCGKRRPRHVRVEFGSVQAKLTLLRQGGHVPSWVTPVADLNDSGRPSGTPTVIPSRTLRVLAKARKAGDDLLHENALIRP